MGSRSSKKYGSSRRSALQVPKYELNNLAVITVVFNPLKYKSRYELYHKFDEHMSRSGVTLLTVECIFKLSEDLDLPRQKFEITRANDPRHIQIEAPSVLWLKENLINITVARLPSYFEYVAWLDADIEFERLDWPHLTIHLLQEYPIVQLFELASFLGPSGKKEVLRQDRSFAYAIRHQQRIDPRRSSECFVHPGYAWAMHRQAFEAIGGLLEFSILGSGDLHFAYALINRIEETIPAGMHEDYRRKARVWGQRVSQVSNNGASVGYAPIHIWHHWHGSRVNRGYFERWSILEQQQFSPSKDLEKSDQLGLIRLTSRHNSRNSEAAKHSEKLERMIISYFRSRNEDSLKKPVPTINLSMANLKSKISSNDTVRPSSTLPRQYQPSWTGDLGSPYQDDYGYVPMRNARSNYFPNDTNGFSLDMTNDSFPQTFSRGTFPRQYATNDVRGQFIYYDDGDGNEYATSPEDISF